MIRLAIIIVSWNTRTLLRHCIATVHTSLAGSGIAYAIIVVDNASSDETPAMLRAAHPDVVLLEVGSNLGFAGGNNLALQALLASETPRRPPNDPRLETPDYVLLLNPDTEVLGDAIPWLVGYLEAHPDVALVGPQLRYPDGNRQPSRRRFPTPGVFFWESTPLETHWPGNPWAQRYRCTDRPDDIEQQVDWLVGAALLVRRSAIERAGLLDEGFAMYSEELEWQQRIQQTQPGDQGPHRIMYTPDVVIIHHEGKSSEQAPARRYINFQRSRLRHAQMLYGQRFAAALRLFLLAAYGTELTIEACKWLLGHKRELRAARIRIYGEVLRGLL